MPDDLKASQAPQGLFTPQISLDGPVDDAMLRAFKAALGGAGDPDPLVLELTTPGGDPDVGRRIATDIRLYRKRTGRRPLFFGKSVVYSAGMAIMAAFDRRDRWLARETSLLIHCRRLARTLELSGPLRQERSKIEAVLAEIDVGVKLETEGFRELIEGSDITLDELLGKADTAWYLDADEALARGLIGGVV